MQVRRPPGSRAPAAVARPAGQPVAVAALASRRSLPVFLLLALRDRAFSIKPFGAEPIDRAHALPRARWPAINAIDPYRTLGAF